MKEWRGERERPWKPVIVRCRQGALCSLNFTAKSSASAQSPGSVSVSHCSLQEKLSHSDKSCLHQLALYCLWCWKISRTKKSSFSMSTHRRGMQRRAENNHPEQQSVTDFLYPTLLWPRHYLRPGQQLPISCLQPAVKYHLNWWDMNCSSQHRWNFH